MFYLSAIVAAMAAQKRADGELGRGEQQPPAAGVVDAGTSEIDAVGSVELARAETGVFGGAAGKDDGGELRDTVRGEGMRTKIVLCVVVVGYLLFLAALVVIGPGHCPQVGPVAPLHPTAIGFYSPDAWRHLAGEADE